MSLSNWERAFGLAGLRAEKIAFEEGLALVKASPIAASAACPLCGKRSSQVRSRYQRCLADLPAHGRRVRIFVAARRFRCRDQDCRGRIFAERLSPDAARVWGRRTTRLDGIVHHIGFALGGRTRAGNSATPVVARKQGHAAEDLSGGGVPVSSSSPRVIGVDDWAWRKGHRYGTLICDLEQRMVIDLLPLTGSQQRSSVGLPTILASRSSLGIGVEATRKPTAQACPNAEKVADRWHLMENSSGRFPSMARETPGCGRSGQPSVRLYPTRQRLTAARGAFSMKDGSAGRPRRYNPRLACRGDRYQGDPCVEWDDRGKTRPRSRPWRTHRSVPSPGE